MLNTLITCRPVCMCNTRTQTHTLQKDTQSLGYIPQNMVVIQQAFIGLDSVRKTKRMKANKNPFFVEKTNK